MISLAKRPIQIICKAAKTAEIKADAKKVYKTVVAQLFAMNLLQPVDQPALCMFANAIATVYKMQQALDEDGYVVDAYNKDGDVIGKMVNPAQKIMKDAINTANTIGSQFGWSPQARMRLVAMLSQKEEKKDDFNQMING